LRQEIGETNDRTQQTDIKGHLANDCPKPYGHDVRSIGD